MEGDHAETFDSRDGSQSGLWAKDMAKNSRTWLDGE